MMLFPYRPPQQHPNNPPSPFLSSKHVLIKTGTACFKALFYYGYQPPSDVFKKLPPLFYKPS